MANTTLRRKYPRNRPMPPATLGPKESTIQLILSYSKAVQAVEAPPLGTVQLVLN